MSLSYSHIVILNNRLLILSSITNSLYLRGTFLFFIMSVYLSIYVSVCFFSMLLFICMRDHLFFVALSLCLAVCLSVCLSVCLYAHQSACQSVCLSVNLSMCPSLCLSISLSVCPSTCLSISLSACLCVSLNLFAVFFLSPASGKNGQLHSQSEIVRSDRCIFKSSSSHRNPRCGNLSSIQCKPQ